jgi:radical SAM superfamily enzyme YgiQ (UPF0313 family)
MKYLIVMPILTEIQEQAYIFPIGMAYVSSSLKAAGRNVFTYNLNYKSGTIEENLRTVIVENEIDVIATGGLTAQYWQLEQILQAARKIKPDIITWVGGGIITSAPEAAMEALEIADYGMIGEGEVTICELADAVEGLRDRHEVDGLIFKEDGQWVITNPRAEIMNLDALPYPDYEGFEYEQILDKIATEQYAFNNGRFGFVSLGRSCPFNCTFCFHPSGTKYRKRSMDSVFEEIDYLIEHFGIRNISISDELFMTKMEDIREFCKRVKERKVGFAISLRVDMVNRESLTLLRDSGCLQVGFGLESADNTILKSMRKHITIEQIEETLGICYELGVNFSGNFIFGDQAETVETVMNTIRWWKAHPQYRIDLRVISVYPGSELYKIAIQNGLIKDPVQFIKDGCPLVNVSKMSEQEYKNMTLMISMLQQERTERLEDVSVQYIGFGKVALTAKCPKCGRTNSWRGVDVFRSLGSLICKECNKPVNAAVCDYIGDTAEKNYQKLEGHKIGVWGMINGVGDFLEKVPSARKENTYLIDRAEMKQGAEFERKTVYDPSVIAKEGIDTVFITVTTAVATEIIEEIKNHYTGVKNVFFLGDLIDEAFERKVGSE